MNSFRHGLKEAYKQLGRNTFCCIFLTLGYLAGAVGFSSSSLSIGSYFVSALFSVSAALTGSLVVLSFIAHYLNLFKVYIQHSTTKQQVMLRHSARHVDIPGWVLHRTDGPAVSGFDLHSEEDFYLFYVDGIAMEQEIFEKIAFAKSKGELSQFLTSPDEHQRNFAKFKMRSL